MPELQRLITLLLFAGPFLILSRPTPSAAAHRLLSTIMPFHGQDAWRRHPLFTNLWKDPLPGFRPAVMVFGAYMVGEYAYKWLNYQMLAPSTKKGGH